LSSEQLTKYFPFGCSHRDLTQLSCPVKVNIQTPPIASHNFIVLSLLAEIKYSLLTLSFAFNNSCFFSIFSFNLAKSSFSFFSSLFSFSVTPNLFAEA